MMNKMNFVSWLMRKWFGNLARYNPWRLHCNLAKKLSENWDNWAGYVIAVIPFGVGSMSYSGLVGDTKQQMADNLLLALMCYVGYGVVLLIHSQYFQYRREQQQIWEQLQQE